MAKRKCILIIVLVLIIAIILVIFKAVNLHKYGISNDELANKIGAFNIDRTITINHTKDKIKDYLVFNEIKIRNDFKGFAKITEGKRLEDSVKYKVIVSTNNKSNKAQFWMGVTDEYMTYLKGDLSFYNTNTSKALASNLSDFLDHNGIYNDVDLFKFLSNKDSFKNNLLTSIKDMKEKYSVQFISSVIMPDLNSISLIEGDYQGYILNSKKNIKEVNLLKNGKRYVLTFVNTDYFTDEYIQELLTTITIQ